MAAYVESRQLTHLEPGFPSRFSSDHFNRSGSPVPTCSFPGPITEPYPLPVPQPAESFSDDDDDDNDEHYSVLQPNVQLEPSILDERDASTAENWIERNPSLIRVTENQNHPFNAEPPLSRLLKHGFVTPAQLHFVSNRGQVPKTNWADWTVEVCGLVNRPYRFSMDRLATEFRPRELPVTLVGAGNRRSEQNASKQTEALENWGAGAVSTSVWKGARLRDVLRRCGILSRRRGALYVCFEGVEDMSGGSGGGAKNGTAIRREVAMDPARDVILAYMQNGEVLAPDHGFPVRVIMPGFVEDRMIKWLKKITVTTQVSENFCHDRDNRVFPSHVDAMLANSERWWDKPEYRINEMNINSVITSPCHEEILTIRSATARETYTLRGYAYSGGGKKVTRVEVTMDGGETWLVCQLNHLEKPTKYGKYWCWCFWSLVVESLHLLAAQDMAVRAWDECLNTQPQNLNWNLTGMMNNCWFRVKTHVCKRQGGEIGLVLQHPTAPGNPAGGWMAREKRLVKTSAEAVGRLKKSLSSPFIISSSQSSNNTASATAVISTGEVSSAAALAPGKKIPCKLISKTVLSPDVRLFRFSLPDAGHVLGLPIGKHLLLASTINGKLCMRAYTPTSPAEEEGHFDLLIKVYRKGIHTDFPDGGLMSQHLDSQPLGAELAIKGPIGHIEYTGRGIFSVHGKPRFARQLAMIAGGTGITPIFQVVRAVMADPGDETEMHVVYANRTEDEIMLREELDRWAAEGRGRLKMWYVVGRSVKEGWKYSTGRINEDILSEHIPLGGEDTLAMACGPPGMIQSAVPILEKLNYDVKNSFLIF